MTAKEWIDKILSLSGHTRTDVDWEAVDEIDKLIKRDTAEKLDYEADGYYDGELVYDTAICRSCGRRFEVDYEEEYLFCPNCGQRLDWSEW